MVHFLECGDLHAGFARVRCGECGNEYLLAYSCKGRHFCPSCHQKRTVEFAECHMTFSIPKILRPYFLYDRKLLADLSRCAWEAIRFFMPCAVDEQARQPSAILATQTFGDFPDRYHPHVHGLVADGVFTEQGDFVLAPQLDAEKLTELFRHKVLKMLLARGKITRERIRMMDGWNHSGFHVHCGPRIHPDDRQAMENLAAYIVRATFSQTRMQYCPEKGQVVYRSRTAGNREPTTPWNGSRPWSPTYPARASSW